MDHTNYPAVVNAPTFDLDDAFSDGDDVDFEFSPDVIREEIVRTRSNGEFIEDEDEEPQSTSNAFFHGHDASVSTLDMDGAGVSASSVPSTSSPSVSPDGSPQFVSISLSRSTSGAEVNDNEEQHREAPKTEEVTTEEETSTYPNVQIDVSQPPSHRVTLSIDSNQSRASTEHQTLQLDSQSPRPSSDMSSPHPAPSAQSLPVSMPERCDTPSTSTSSPSVSASGAITASSSLPNTQPSQLAPPQPSHRQTRSAGPSILEKVMSKTRPSFLPPKSRQEDKKHMLDWQSMMKQSRAAAEKRRKAFEERRIVRERKIDESIHLWERDIVPDWRVVNKNPALRRMWWRGIPSKLRASMWERAVGNPLALNKDNYRVCLSRAKRALTSGTFPQATLELIEKDISTTLPALHIFHHEKGPMYTDLKDMLFAWVVSRTDEGLGYTLGAARIAAMLLINVPLPHAFVVMRNLLERHCLRSFFGGDGAREDVEAYYRIFDTLLADGMPKIYFNFKQHQISPASYLPDWLIPLFLDHLPFEACARVWDVLILEGDSFLYRAALGILAVLEPRLFFPDKKELLELLKGENKAAIDVATREGQKLDGGKYEIYGVDEESLWDRIDSMDDWWKESTWTRLIQRELPDL
ncbi:rab-GTPase-TBC domain-containing protein [Armillaria novae-zelandiae]|uniref:Rab-GTPase-TBC domain-containing protein n=1 Tax=Armillaria novae-zelandiae TaxID=153914 RepID=A0AA39PDB3_9AGAR|nr:rab-GTPase-TBC domain-containing protein [Armillaria novae-zelandiae]